MKKLKKIVLGFSLICLLGFVGAIEFVLPYVGIKPFRMKPDPAWTWKFPKGIRASDYGLKAKPLDIKTSDNILLKALLCESNTDSTYGIVVVLHGLSSCKETQFGRAAMLANAGFASLLLDLRAHGESGGDYNTFGFHEKYDVKCVIDTLKSRFPNKKVGIWGASLGGAIALQSMGNDPRVEFGIIESTFDEYYKVATEYGEDYTGIKNEALARHVTSKSGTIAGFEPDSISPCQYACRISYPMLFMHGDRDDKIPIEFNQRNYECCPSNQKEWITVPGATHHNLWDVGGAGLEAKLNDFLRRVR